MKALFISLLCLASVSAFALEEGQIVMTTPKVQNYNADKSNITEAGLTYSSINDGSAFATVGVIHEWDNGFGLGVRGYLPIGFQHQEQAYLGNVVARFIILNEIDQMFIEGSMGQGFFNGKNEGQPFYTIGAGFGYMHKFTDKLAAGGILGIDYSDKRITDDLLYNDRTLYSKVSVFGSYYF